MDQTPGEPSAEESNRVRDALVDLDRRRRSERARLLARSPKRIADVVSRVVLKNGYGRVDAEEALADAWQKAVPESMAKFTRVGRVRRGKLEIHVTSSIAMQELTFAKAAILAKIQTLLADQGIRDLRFTSGGRP